MKFIVTRTLLLVYHQILLYGLYLFLTFDMFYLRYVSVGDIARVGSHPPNVAAVYHKVNKLFTLPIGYDLVRNMSVKR